MREKQFDHIENKIREAAENVEPGFDEQSWQKMEQLLDKENDRKRPLIWFLLPVLLCASIAGYFMFGHKTTSPKVAVVAQEQGILVNDQLKKQSTPIDVAKENNDATKNVLFEKTTTQKENDVSVTTPRISSSATTNSINTKIKSQGYLSGMTDKNGIAYNDLLAENKIGGSSYRKSGQNKGKSLMKITNGNAVSDDTNDAGDVSTVAIDENSKTVPVSTKTIKKTDSSTSAKSIVKNIEKEKIKDNTAAQKTTAENKKERKPSRFYFQATAGAEASSVKLFSLDNNAVVAKYGLGVGYRLNDRLSVQSGFNISRKKYIAGAGDYNAKAGSYWSMVEIKKVDANCLVYEIPLALRYDLLQKRSFSIYATAGISSFIMKKEDYNYHYIRDNNYYEHTMAYTGNKNLFSVLSLSAGVEKKLNNGFSLLAEPSVSLPVAGVGDGSVKLYSVGLQVGLKYQPFKKKK